MVPTDDSERNRRRKPGSQPPQQRKQREQDAKQPPKRPPSDATPSKPEPAKQDESELEPFELAEHPDNIPPASPKQRPDADPTDGGEPTQLQTLELAEPTAPDPPTAPPRARLYPEDEEDRYCLACGQSLRGVDARECPTCHHPFDPSDPHTHRKRPLPSAAPTSAQSLGVKIGLGVVLGLLLLGRLVVVLMASSEGEHLSVLATHPFWIAAVIWLTVSLIRNDRFHGLIFWMLVGAATGARLGALEGSCALASGFFVGLMAGMMREYMDLASA